MNMEKPLFSVCLISKNESKTLPRLMGSLKEFQEREGEVVILDTGSTDGTPDLARSLGCKVIEVGPKYVIEIDEAQVALYKLVLGQDISPVS